MSPFDTLPVLLVSAIDENVATGVISELIDNDVTGEYVKETQAPGRVWRLVNKYYTADVRVHALPDDAILDLNPETIQAHIIHITEDELGRAGGVSAAERRAAAGPWRRCAVRVLLAEGGAERAAPAALAAWAGRARAELAARRERAPAPAAPRPFADEYGMQRVRAALHAHPWPNLVRAEGTRPIFPAPLDDSSDDGDSDASSESISESAEDAASEERRAVEQAEAFAAALGALAAAPRAPPEHVPREARLDHAEALLAAFCRALGVDPRSA